MAHADPVFLKAPDGNYVHFEWDTEKNDTASTAANRPMFDKVLIMHVVSPGSPKSSPAHVVEREKPGEESTPVDFFVKRYGQQIDAFKNSDKGGALTGTPLEQLPFLDLATRATLKAMAVHTAEALADLSESGVQNVGMGARMWKQQATAWLEQAAGGAPMTRLLAVNEKLVADNARLAALLADLGARVDRMEQPGESPVASAATTRGRGRPRKNEAA